MASTKKGVENFLDNSPVAALIKVAEAKGSTPREKGAWMLVSPEATFGTIGGGQLEFMAIAKAREAIVSRSPAGEDGASGVSLNIPLGPEIGQCCGGHVELSIRHVDSGLRDELTATAAAEDGAYPHVYLFGGGHVGHALASALSLLPLKVTVVETRADALEGMPEAVTTRLTPMPEEAVRAAPAGSAFVVLTHDHALDFLIVGEALKRPDAAYIGMIGSKTKKATCKSWYLKTAGGTEEEFARLVSPIGGSALRDKRPSVIAALAAAEIMRALAKPE
ncbi:xanthine dehydrogenase accessory protein XdhC [Mesorhizobium koreense]|jgi:xanthine dehydrogenase accessory factor|uniref:xanthine dehydrogenase accessory protein XdhC n=1 Tax=Mesorhizobium koreense TaxID=3074855 RepID=UPI00287BC63B|nr:xanthine dehydrogenase accessory protein XdhC [Mesorhizobium sp. WR6]